MRRKALDSLRTGLTLVLRTLAAVVTLLAVIGPIRARADPETPDKDLFHAAADFCRGSAPKPMTLALDHRIVCFDGWLAEGTDLSAVRELADRGLFVARSQGGDITTAIALSSLLRDRHATIVIYDYCLSACANYLFIAADQTYVVKDSIVAWRGPVSGLDTCTSLSAPGGGEPRKLEYIPCPGISAGDLLRHKRAVAEAARFYAERTIGPLPGPPPKSTHVRRTLKNLYGEIGFDPKIAWTLNPRLDTLFKTKIAYEAYPQSQEQVDSLAERLHIGKVIFDP